MGGHILLVYVCHVCPIKCAGQSSCCCRSSENLFDKVLKQVLSHLGPVIRLNVFRLIEHVQENESFQLGDLLFLVL